MIIVIWVTFLKSLAQSLEKILSEGYVNISITLILHTLEEPGNQRRSEMQRSAAILVSKRQHISTLISSLCKYSSGYGKGHQQMQVENTEELRLSSNDALPRVII